MATSMLEPITPTERDVSEAREAVGQLARSRHSRSSLQLRIVGDSGSVAEFPLPQAALRLLQTILAQMAEGNSITIIPNHAELTTQQAADFLSVSRPYLIGLLEKGEVPFRKVGTHRRILFSDLTAYQKEAKEAQRYALDELTAQAQELGMGYE